jgi:16S rRNA processing protein RimM
VLRPHGLRGEVRVFAFNPAAPHLQQGSNVYVAGVRHGVVMARPDRGGWIIELSGVPSRTLAEALQGELLEAPDHEIAPEEGAFFVHDLIGMTMVTVDGRRLGEVVEVLDTGANDVYVARGEDGREVLIPAIGEVVAEIDPEAREIRITPLPGLLDDSG